MNNNSNAKAIIAFIGLIASCIGIFAFATGWSSIGEILRTISASPDTNRYSNTVTVPPTSIPLVSNPTVQSPTKQPTQVPPTQVPPAPTPVPPPTPVPDTVPGTILEDKQAWRQGGLELTMVWLTDGTRRFLLKFYLANLQSYDRSFRFSLENFSAVDNRGRRVQISPTTSNISDTMLPVCLQSPVVLPANKSIDLIQLLICKYPPGHYHEQDEAEYLNLLVDGTDTSINEVIVSATNISSITGARWRIQIYH